MQVPGSTARFVIRPVDPWDEHEMDVLQDLYVEAQRAGVPDARLYSRPALTRPTP